MALAESHVQGGAGVTRSVQLSRNAVPKSAHEPVTGALGLANLARVLILLTILDAAFQFGSHPTYSLVGSSTRGPKAQLSIPDQGSYLALCTILSSEINNNKSIKWLQRVGGIYHTQLFCIQGH